MNTTLKKVLSYIAVAFFGFASGVGCLIGVSSCSSNNGNDQQEKQKSKVQPKEKKITPGLNGEAFDASTTFDKDKTYYMVVKNYANQGKGYLWSGDSISVANSSSYSGSSEQNFNATFDLIDNDLSVYRYVFNLIPTTYQGVSKLDKIQIHNSNWSTNRIIYNASGSSFNRQYCAFLFTNFGYVYPSDSTRVGYFYYNINQWFDIYEVEDNYFEFSETINYNATYGQDLDSFVVNDSYFSDNSHLFKEVTLFSGVPFYSGGLVFDTITLAFDNAYATKFRTNENNIQAWSSFNFGYFHEMRYKNSATNLIISVNTRIFEAYYNANESGLYLTRNSKWVSKAYQKISFLDNITETQIVNLSKLNNSSYSGGYYDGSSTSVGLENVFGLISLAFASWVPILQIQIVPGITIGLLLFLPLISGIIILVIWIVKR